MVGDGAFTDATFSTTLSVPFPPDVPTITYTNATTVNILVWMRGCMGACVRVRVCVLACVLAGKDCESACVSSFDA
jgi:hypothetical protein